MGFNGSTVMYKSDTNIFQPVSCSSKSEAIALQIEAAIADRLFVPGDKLPSERRLQSLFQTSRGAVREALRTLRQKGLLQTKKGARGGYYVKKINIHETIDQLAGMIKQQEVPLKKLLEFHYAMDQGVLIGAISNATEFEIKSMQKLADQLQQLCDQSSPDLNQISIIDKKLNLLMVEMTKNPFFEWVMQTVQVSFRAYEFIVYELPDVRKTIALNWKNTARAIDDKDVQKALGLYGHWYVLLEQCLQQRYGKNVYKGKDKYNILLSKKDRQIECWKVKI